MISDRKCIKIRTPIWKELKHRATEHETSISDVIRDLLNGQLLDARTQKIVAQNQSPKSHIGPMNTQSTNSPVQIPSTMQKTYTIGQNLVAQFNFVERKQIDSAICKVAGADPRTINQYFNLLLDEKVLVAGHKEGKVRVWKVNHVGGWLPYHMKDYPEKNM